MQMVDNDIDVALYRTNTVTAHRPEAFSEMDSNCFERIFSVDTDDCSKFAIAIYSLRS